MNNYINSKENSKIKYVRSLYTKKYRDEEKAFVVEGTKFVLEAIKEKANLNYIIIKASFRDKIETSLNLLDEQRNILYFICDDDVFDSISDTVNSQGVLAVIKKREYFIEDIITSYKYIVFLDRIQDPGNLGTMLRTVDAFYPAALVLNKGCTDVYSPKVARSSAGSIFRVPLVYCQDEIKTITNLKKNGFKVYSTVVDSSLSFEDILITEKICIIIGNEGSGVSQEIINLSDQAISIHMSGKSESLNASIAAGITIFETKKKLL